MNCEWVKSNATLYVYDELADDARFELEQHINRCGECEQEVEILQGFKMTMSTLPILDPSPNLLAASRMRLQEALEGTTPNAGWRRFTFDLAGWLHQMKFSPALTAALLILGFTGGALTTYRVTVIPGRNTIAPVVAESGNMASIAGIRSIVPDPGSNRVSIQYDRLQPDAVQGSLDDPQVQQLLLLAARNNVNSGVRLDSIGLLSQKPDDDRIREALVSALRYDKNPGIRLKALEGLRAYVKGDTRVRDAVLEALLNDSNPGVRSEAIGLIESAKADYSVRQALSVLATRDSDQYIRTQSRRVLANLPEIE